MESGAPVTFMSRLDAASREALNRVGQSRRFDRGTNLTREGATTDQVLLLEEGWAKIAVAADDGVDVVIGLRGPGDLVGELVAVDGPGTGRAATVTALTDLRSLVVPGAAFLRFVDEHPCGSSALLRDVVARLRAAGIRLALQGSLPVEAHLGRLLLELLERAGARSDGVGVIDLGLTQHDLAGLLGCSRDAVAKALGSMRRGGVITTSRRSIVVTDLDELRRLARI